ncbi:DciA family protein [Streptomyces lavendulae]|uniref:DciA family protein n=1 Tax=Streptomyces lavendulae TaxID=1914 RepID=UPI00367C0E55
MSSAETSGVDLARVALRAAREAARKNGAGQKTKQKARPVRTVPRSGREPMGLGAALGVLVTERAWDIPAAGGAVLDRWPAIAAALAPQLPDHVQAVAFHPETGQLDLRPDSPACATQLRLITARMVAEANSMVGAAAVRTVRVLPVGGVPAPWTAQQAPVPAVAAPDAVPVQAPVKSREMASSGFHRALAAHQAVAPVSRADPAIAEAVERQTQAMRELRLRAFPEPEPVADDHPAAIEQARAKRRQADASHTAALHRARAERAQRTGAAVILPQPAPRRASSTARSSVAGCA